MQQPVTILYIKLAGGIIGLVPGTSQTAAIGKQSGEAVLPGLGGMNIKKGYFIIKNLAGIAVMNCYQMNTISDNLI